MGTRSIIFGIVLYSIMMSCNSRELKPGICLSFDDKYIDEWFQLRHLFNEHQAKVTFFISHFDSLSEAELKKLRILEADGHEIGSHGAGHFSAEKYIKQHGHLAYYKNEVVVNYKKMRAANIKACSFAYPYGSEFWFIDFFIYLKHKVIRGIAYAGVKYNLSDTDKFYVSGRTKKVYAAQIDYITKPTMEMIKPALKRTMDNNEILVLFGHKPDFEDNNEPYSFSVDLLAEILSEVRLLNLKYYRVCDLNSPNELYNF
jgi:peptidoglycan-N-acetylglucosamine deacetylase